MEANEKGTSELYPGVYDIQEHRPVDPPGWQLIDVTCELYNGDLTGSETPDGETGIKIQAGKETTCTFEYIKSNPKESEGGRAVKPDSREKPKGSK